MELITTKDKGAHFHRCDLQVHSPRDPRWAGRSYTEDADRADYAARLIASCREKKLDAIAITDHHDMVFVNYVKQAADQETDINGNAISEHSKIVVFPGVELTLAVPCQAILLLDAEIETECYEQVLRLLTIQPSPITEKNTPQPKRLENIQLLSDLKAKLDEHDWLKNRYIIFPNVSNDKESSLLRRGMAPKYKDMPFVGGYIDGSKKNLKHGALNILTGKEKEWGHRRIACIQTSDNRREDHSDLGVHSSWIKWARPTAEALRQACLAQESRISDDKPSLPSVTITSVRVTTSVFLGSLAIALNPQYNALIGGRGTGKSTILEYIRWALCDDPPFVPGEEAPDYQTRRTRLIESTLKPCDATVDVEFMVQGVLHVVRRSSRDDSVQIKIGDSELTTCTKSQIRSLLPIQAYSQKQLSNVSIRLDELERFITAPIRLQLDELERLMLDQETKIKNLFSSLTQQKAIRKNISRLSLEKHSFKEQANKIRASLQPLTGVDKNLLNFLPCYNWAEQAVESRRDKLIKFKEKINELASNIAASETNHTPELPSDYPERDLLNGLFIECQNLSRQIDSALREISEQITHALSEYSLIKWIDWQEKISSFRDSYDLALERSSERKTNLAELTKIESKVGDIEREISDLAEELARCNRDAEKHSVEQEQLYELRQQRDSMIEEQCATLAKSSKYTIKARLLRYSNPSNFISTLKEKLKGSKFRERKIEQIAHNIVNSTDPKSTWRDTINDLWNLANFNPDTESSDHLPETNALGDAEITPDDCIRLSRKLTPDDWLLLSLTEIESKPVFEYRLSEDEYIPFSNASSGQQATALLHTLLNQDGPPLLIDQPEEDLDNPIMQKIVEQVWSAKTHRQIIFVSHNANLVVNGDAELVAWCEHREGRGIIAGQGAIDMPQVKDAIKQIMEGGEAAFNLRREKYGF